MPDCQSTSPVTAITPRNGVVVLSGYGIRVAVERGHLIVEDGIGRERRSGRFSRVARGIKRLVVIGHTGTISFDALRWIDDIGASFAQIDADGKVLASSGPLGLDDARLRRAQALAATNGIGIAIARDLLRTKLAGQQTVLTKLPNTQDARDRIDQMVIALDGTNTAEQLRIIESDAARTYWQEWRNVPIRFAKRNIPRVPSHWLSFDSRFSPLANGPRSAATPANALLNYVYAILEMEARIAVIAVGLDPGMGVLHADQRGRNSLALDVMEAVRPTVDDFVLDLLTTRTFRADDFFETRQGVCRILPPLTKVLAETAPRWQRAIAPLAERVAKVLFEGEGIVRTRDAKKIATPLTQANRSAARDEIRRKVKRSTTKASLPATCAGCGMMLDDRQRHYCDACLPEHEAEKLAALMMSGPDALAQMRAEGRDPTKTAEALRRQSNKMIEQRRAAREWEHEHPEKADPAVFVREILPKIQDVPLNALMAATGLSKRSCSIIRRGLSVPHMRHWQALGACAQPPRR